jgi:argininosuccinate lyase
MAMKLWSGRFKRNTDALVDELNASITFDSRLFREDIMGSIAHATMLGETGIISLKEAEKIRAALYDILDDIEEGKLVFTLENEDIHMSIEAELTRRIGETGKRLHTARSRNDQVALDIRLYLKREICEIRELILSLIATLHKIADPHTQTVMPAYTHLQRAQPTTFAHYMMAYANMFRRDVLRLEDCLERMDESPLGSGALTGTTYPIDREMVADALGFKRITQNSLDGVSDRDFALEFLSDLSILMMHLSRLSEEIIMWCSWEFGFVELDDAYSTGSSIMPQKKNPDIAELVRGKTGRVYGDLMALLTVMKALPLAYNKDMQEDKEPLFDAIDTVKKCLPVFTAMLDTMTVRTDKMRAAASGGFINATDCADYLVKKGLAFRDAYTIVGKLVSHCISSGKTLETLTLEEYRGFSSVFEADVFEAISLETCVNGRNVPGGPSVESVRAQMSYINEFLKEKTR